MPATRDLNANAAEIGFAVMMATLAYTAEARRTWAHRARQLRRALAHKGVHLSFRDAVSAFLADKFERLTCLCPGCKDERDAVELAKLWEGAGNG